MGGLGCVESHVYVVYMGLEELKRITSCDIPLSTSTNFVLYLLLSVD